MKPLVIFSSTYIDIWQNEPWFSYW